MVKYFVIDKRTNEEVSFEDVLYRDGVIFEEEYKYRKGLFTEEEEREYEEENSNTDMWYGFSLTTYGALFIYGAEYCGGDYTVRCHSLDSSKYEAVLIND